MITFIKRYLHWIIIFFQKGSTWKTNVPFLICSRFYIFYHFINLEFYDALMNISTQITVHFWIYLLNHKSFDHKFSQRIGKAMSISFSKMLTWFEGLGPKFNHLFNLLMYLLIMSLISYSFAVVYWEKSRRFKIKWPN